MVYKELMTVDWWSVLIGIDQYLSVLIIVVIWSGLS